MFSSLLFNQRTRRFWNERNHAGKPGVAREISTPSRRTNAAGRSVGTLLYLASVGLTAAAIIGIFFGTGFWLLASPVSETITNSGRGPLRPNGNALRTSEDRGRDAHYYTPPAQIRTSPIRASGSCLGCLTTKR